MNKRIVSTLVALVLFTGFALPLTWSKSANADDQSEFQTRKSDALKSLDEHIQKLQEHKNCVNSAENPEAMKKCRAAMKTWRQELKREMKSRRAANRD